MERGGSRRRGEAGWRQVLVDWRRSGETIRAFCGRLGISTASLYRWRRRFEGPGRRGPGPAPAPAFTPVRVIASGSDALPVEILLRCGRRIRCGADVPPDTLARLASALERLPC